MRFVPFGNGLACRRRRLAGSWGGGPSAFTKYEAGTLKPAASLVNLLRVLEADPAAITKLGGHMPRPIATQGTGLFEVTGRHIEALTDRAERMFPELLRRLLVAEAQVNEVPASGVHVASSINTPDGGEDGRIEWTGGPDRTRFLPGRLCQFQLKGAGVKPAEARRDVLATSGEAKDMGSFRARCRRPLHRAVLPFVHAEADQRAATFDT